MQPQKIIRLSAILKRAKLSSGMRFALMVLLALAVVVPAMPFGGVAQAQIAPAAVLTAQTITAAVPSPVLTPVAANAKADTTAVMAGVPAGTVLSFRISGVVTAKDAAGQLWQIGTQAISVNNSASTRVDNAPVVGDLVRVVANRGLDAGPIIAERITLIRRGPLAARRADVLMSLVFTGTVTTTTPGVWTIGGSDFIINDPFEPAVIDPGLVVGSSVSVTFTAAAPLVTPATTTAPATAPVATTPSVTPAPVGPFNALEIFSPVEVALPPGIPVPPMVVPATLSASPKPHTVALPTNVPVGTAALFVISGVVKSVDNLQEEWQIGTEPLFVYTSANTVIRGAPQAGDLVKIVANRTMVPGPIVAEVITLTQAGPIVLTPAVTTIALLYQGVVETAGPHIWRVGGVDFIVDDVAAPAAIDPGLNIPGTMVVVEFLPAAAPAPVTAPVPGAAATATVGPFTAMEISAGVAPAAAVPGVPAAPVTPLAVPAPLARGAKANTIAIPSTAPAGSIALFVISGVVRSVDAAQEVWQIGNPPVTVYTSAATKIVGAPKSGDLVKIVANRTVAPGPIVAEKVTLSQAGPVALAPAATEMALLFQGAVESVGPHIWRVGGVDFIVDDVFTPAAIDPGMGVVGNTVVVEFAVPPALVTLVGGAGPGYATGLLNMSISAIQLLLEKPGQVKDQPGQLEVKGRQYEAIGSLPVTINGTALAATEVKVISNLKTKAGIGQHQGTIDVDIDILPGGHVTLGYKGTANVTGSTIVSTGTFQTTKATGVFAGLVAEGAYSMTISESGATFGAPATVTISTMSVTPAALAPQQTATAPVPGITIVAGGSGPGYPTGPLNIIVSGTQLLLDTLGQVKEQPGQLEVKDRKYEAIGALPVTINGTAFTATEIKVISNLKARGGTGQHQGTIDVDIDILPGGHVTLAYQGSATITGSNIVSTGTFKTSKTTGIFAGLVAEGTYNLSISESGSVLGAPAMVNISTQSLLPATLAAQQAAPAPVSQQATPAPVPGITIVPGGTGPGYATGPLDILVNGTQLILDRVGQVKDQPGQLEVKDRQYEALGFFPVTINSTAFTANEIKVISNLKIKSGTGQHQGTIDVDIDTIPGGHLTLEYNGTATLSGSTIMSKGKFKTTKTTGNFTGLVADGAYDMSITELGNTLGSPAMVTIMTKGTLPATLAVPAPSTSTPAAVGATTQPPATGIIITGGVSGPGYPTGPLNLSVPSAQLIINQAGQVKEQPGQLEVKGRQYEGMGFFPVTINNAAFTANEIKVMSNLKLSAGTGDHQGTIDVDIDTIPGGHLTLDYRGTATMAASFISSSGSFKTSKATGSFAGLVASGTYKLTIVETGPTLGSPVTISISLATP